MNISEIVITHPLLHPHFRGTFPFEGWIVRPGRICVRYLLESGRSTIPATELQTLRGRNCGGWMRSSRLPRVDRSSALMICFAWRERFAASGKKVSVWLVNKRFRKLRPDLAQMPRRGQHSSRRVPSPTAHRRCPVAGVPCASLNRRLQRVPLRCFLRRLPLRRCFRITLMRNN